MSEYFLGAPIADTKAPQGPIEQRWSQRKFEAKLVNPANRRKHKIIVVGTGLAGGSAGATLAEQGYHVIQFCFQDSPRRAHSVAAQGGINAAKNYRNDGDSPYRLFYDTVKGGDFRSRESNVYRLAEISTNIIDQCVAQGVPFAREYGGLLDTRSFGGRSTHAARPASNCSSAPIRRSSGRSAPATSRCIRAPRCST
jgi:succinate dehydrogenase / fumarate reductase flavoprotein subunit